jgi:glycosyltransferase involved in cell wall biosynthesis
MDIFAFPSLYEGLGMAAVEAQAAGIVVIASRNIPKEANVGLMYFSKLDRHFLSRKKHNNLDSFDSKNLANSLLVTYEGKTR